MKNWIFGLKSFLENLDGYRDKTLFLFIKPYWPRFITPNQITYVRLLISIFLFVLLFWLSVENKILIITLFAIGVITDLIDGPVARGTNRVTEFGAMLDSTADRLLIIPVAIYSLWQTNGILLLILMLTEVANAVLSIYYKSKEIYLESDIFGKVKMTLYCIVLISILFVFPAAPSSFFTYMLWLTIPLSLLSISLKILKLKKC